MKGIKAIKEIRAGFDSASPSLATLPCPIAPTIAFLPVIPYFPSIPFISFPSPIGAAA